MWDSLEKSISKATYKPFVIQHKTALTGGSINNVYRIEGGGSHYFVKFNHTGLNQPDKLDMFKAEAAGLRELIAAQAIRIPLPLCVGAAADAAWLVTEYIELGRGKAHSSQSLGQQLAVLHRSTSDQFGWCRDNTIGSTAQYNAWTSDWLTFYREQRLAVQFKLAADNGFTGALQSKGDRLMANLQAFFSTNPPQPSLLHGDLWAGNCAFDAAGSPVIFDPAVYYGDREADLAMTELFGRFPADFYAAYREAWPLDEGYPVRKVLYNLYHILNHANLFGGGYAVQAESMLDFLLAEI